MKLAIDDGHYPALDALADQVGRAHRHHRCAAIHSVTQASLVLALAPGTSPGAGPVIDSNTAG